MTRILILPTVLRTGGGSLTCARSALEVMDRKHPATERSDLTGRTIARAFDRHGGYGFYTAHGDYNKTKELFEKLLPAVIGLLGSAIGFYFGRKNGRV